LTEGPRGLEAGTRFLASILVIVGLYGAVVSASRWREFLDRRDRARQSLLNGTSLFNL
jgi:hypothetical protein